MKPQRISVEIEPLAERDSNLPLPPVVLVDSAQRLSLGKTPDTAIFIVPDDDTANIEIEGDTQTTEYGEWCEMGGVRVRITAGGDTLDELTLANHRQWAAPEIRLAIAGATGHRELRCKLPLDEGAALIVGRKQPEADLIVEDQHVSRVHARFFVRDGKHFVEDCDSRWGTKINGNKLIAPHELKHNDVITIGKSQIEFINVLDMLPLPQETPESVLDSHKKVSSSGATGSSISHALDVSDMVSKLSSEGSAAGEALSVSVPSQSEVSESIDAPPSQSMDGESLDEMDAREMDADAVYADEGTPIVARIIQGFIVLIFALVVLAGLCYLGYIVFFGGNDTPPTP